jgi:dTDP-4-dehydrorhamnose 3,5-epimerase
MRARIIAEQRSIRMLKIENTAIEDVRLYTPQPHTDSRGMFVETYNLAEWTSNGLDVEFVQDNLAQSTQAWTVRGLHYQLPPRAQGKLVRVVAGEIYDVVVDIRRSSGTFLNWIAVRLHASNCQSLYVPPGFAHGYCTMRDDTIVEYKVTDYYSPDHERCLNWCDPLLNIEWPISAQDAVLSDKDKWAAPISDRCKLFD